MARRPDPAKHIHDRRDDHASSHLAAAVAPEVVPGGAPGVVPGGVPGGVRAEAATPSGFVARFWAWMLLLFLGVVWGLSFSLAKIAVGGGAHPLGITLWQALLGASFLIAFGAVGRRPISRKPQAVQLYVICGLLGTVVPGILFFYAAARVPAGVLSITVTVVPILTFLLAALFRVERFALGRVVGVLCGALAVVLLIAPEQSLPESSAAPWVLAACAASACYAAENLVIALRMPEGVNPFMVTCGMFLAATALLTPVVIATDSFVPLAWPWGPVEWAIVGMAAIGAVAYGLFIYLVNHAGPVFASQTAYAVTLAGVLWGMAIFGERYSLWIWLSLVLMMAGLALVTPGKNQRTARSPATSTTG